jgi:hypothetical protein
MQLCNARRGIGVGVTVLVVAGIANAAPTTMRMPARASVITQAAVHCWYRNGVRHCRGARSYGYVTRYHQYGNPDALRPGSSRWWRAMQRENRSR